MVIAMAETTIKRRVGMAHLRKVNALYPRERAGASGRFEVAGVRGVGYDKQHGEPSEDLIMSNDLNATNNDGPTLEDICKPVPQVRSLEEETEFQRALIAD